jgi:hypothetical protein
MQVCFTRISEWTSQIRHEFGVFKGLPCVRIPLGQLNRGLLGMLQVQMQCGERSLM